MKPKTKKFLISMWDSLVLIAYSMFYAFCIIVGGMVFLLTMVMIKELGGDYSTIAKEVPIVLRVITFFVGVIVLDKISKFINKHKSVETKK